MGRGSGGTRSSDKTHTHINGEESPVLFHGGPEEWYDWDGSEAIDYIERVTNHEVEGVYAEETFEALRSFVDDGQHDIREAQRGNIEGRPEDYAFALEQFIDYAPNYKGTTYRGVGMNESQFESLKKGDNYGNIGLKSWSTKLEQAKSFDYNPSGNEVKVVLRCQKQKAVSVRFAAKYADEHEVIASGYNKYKIKKISDKQKWGGYIVDLTQV